jgi:hypothetical protein
LFGHIDDILLARGLVLFAAQKLQVPQDDWVFYCENETMNKYKDFQPSQICRVTETEINIIEQSEIVNKVVYIAISWYWKVLHMFY